MNMVKKYGNRRYASRRAQAPEQLGQNIFLLLKRMGGSSQRARLASLWREWAEVMGAEFSWLVPLGHRERTLFLGVEDAMEIQEISLQSPRILELANAYMECEYFSRLRVSILPGKGDKP